MQNKNNQGLNHENLPLMIFQSFEIYSLIQVTFDLSMKINRIPIVLGHFWVKMYVFEYKVLKIGRI